MLTTPHLVAEEVLSVHRHESNGVWEYPELAMFPDEDG